MVKFFLSIFIVLLFSLNCFSQNEKGSLSLVSEKYDIKYASMTFDINENVIKSEVEYNIKASENLNSISLDLSDSAIVDSVYFLNNKIVFNHINNLLSINFNSQISENQFIKLNVFYKTYPSDTSLDSPLVLNYNEGIPVIWSFSEPYSAKYWLPCKQSLTDKIDSIDIYLIVDSIYTGLSNGKLVNQYFENSKSYFHYKHKHPIAYYLIAFCASKYSLIEQDIILNNGDTVKNYNYVYPSNYINAQNSLSVTEDCMKLYSNLFISYPFSNEHYSHVQWSRRGGMEHQTISFMNDFSYELISHELAHSWFGNYITCKTWSDIWINEGFASFFTGLGYERLMDGYWWLPWRKGIINGVMREPNGSVFCTDTTNISRIFNSRLSYGKGAVLLHMLRWEMGDSSLFLAMNNFLRDTNLVYKTASTSDFISHIEAVSNKSYSEFFNDWFYGEGYPIYRIDYKYFDNNLKIELTQTQSHNSVSCFEMKIPVLIKSPQGDSLLILQNTSNYQEFNFNFYKDIDSLIFDPEYWILSPRAEINNISEISSPNNLCIYPNPSFNGEFFIKNSSLIKEYLIYDSNGKLVSQNSNINTNNIKIQIKNKGLFLIMIIDTYKNQKKYKIFNL